MSGAIHEDGIIVKVTTETYFELGENLMEEHGNLDTEDLAELIARIEAGGTHPHHFERYRSSRTEIVDTVPDPLNNPEDRGRKPEVSEEFEGMSGSEITKNAGKEGK